MKHASVKESEKLVTYEDYLYFYHTDQEVPLKLDEETP